jgi:L-alanine-DL-glutamate epimerase-like enolase superfamily enzyme
MRIRRIRADWLHVPIPEERQHTTDFGRIAAFDSTLVRVETEGGLTGFGETKAAVGSAGTCVEIPDRPGLGVTIDEAFVARYRKD